MWDCRLHERDLVETLGQKLPGNFRHFTIVESHFFTSGDVIREFRTYVSSILLVYFVS